MADAKKKLNSNIFAIILKLITMGLSLSHPRYHKDKSQKCDKWWDKLMFYKKSCK